jgi:hypothetical protein
VSPCKVQIYIYQTTGYLVIGGTLKMGTESVPETLENFYALMQLSAREDFGEFFFATKAPRDTVIHYPSFSFK